jgi:hypothetical protein
MRAVALSAMSQPNPYQPNPYQPIPPGGEPGPVAPLPVRRSGIRWKRIAILGVVGGLLLYGLLWITTSFFSGLSSGRGFGIPQDFPVYSGSTLVGWHKTVSTGGSSVSAAWEVSASADSVTAFYKERLNQAPWAITRANPADGSIEFKRIDGKGRGVIRLYSHGRQTRVEMLLLE